MAIWFVQSLQREIFEAQQMDIVIATFNSELLSAKGRITEAVGHAMKAFDGVKLSSAGAASDL